LPASARSSRRGSPAGGYSRPPLAPGTGAGGTRADVTKEHTSVLHAMSGAVAKEFVVALQREVAARAALEREVAEMHAASEELRKWTLGELERLREYGQERVDEIAGDAATARAAAAAAKSASRETENAVAAAFARRRRRVASSRAFEALRLHAAAETRTRRVLMRAAARMQHRCVASALDAWFENVADAKRLRVVAARVAGKWRNASVASAFSSWRVAWRRAAMRHGAVAATIARARLAALAPAFRRWIEYRSLRRARSSTRRRADAKFEAIVRRTVFRAFETWHDRCENARVKKRRVTSGTARLRIRRENVLKRDCFLGWAASGRRARDARRASARARARVGRRVRDGCFSRWRAFTKRNAERSRFVMRTLAR
jgi:protein SFI1